MVVGLHYIITISHHQFHSIVMVIVMTEKMIIVDGSVTCGKTLYLKKKAEYLRKQGKNVFVVGEKEDGDVE